jgi:hypothetical protein
MPDQQRELAALGLVLGLVGGDFRQTDLPGGGNGNHDFDITISSLTIALEITSTSVGEVLTFWDQIGRQSWECSRCKLGWSLSVRPAAPGYRGAEIKVLRQEIEGHLTVLEQADVQSFGLQHPRPEGAAAAAAVDALLQLGVVHGSSVGPPPSGIRPLILIGTSGPAAASDPLNLNTAIERATRENVAKLRRAQADERHLFLWVDSTDPDCYAPLSFGMLPAAGPDLPDGIDRAWVAAWMPGPTVPTAVLWSVTPSALWRSERVRLDPRLAARAFSP